VFGAEIKFNKETVMTRLGPKFVRHGWWMLTVLLTAPLLALANVPNTFSPNTVISSSQVNANFAGLDTRVTALEARAPAAVGAQRTAFTYDATGSSPTLTLALGAGAYTFVAAACGGPTGGTFLVDATMVVNGTDTDLAVLDGSNGGCFSFTNVVTLTAAGSLSMRFGSGGGQGGAMGNVRWARIVATPVASASVATVTN
jgi:hypothetical protein